MSDPNDDPAPVLQSEQIPDEQAVDIPTLQGYLRLFERIGRQIQSVELFDPAGINVNVADYFIVDVATALGLTPIEAYAITSDTQLAQYLQTRAAVAYSVLKIGGTQTNVLICRAVTGATPQSASSSSSSISLSWDNDATRKTWSSTLLTAVTNVKANLEKGNPEKFIPGYNGLSADRQVKYWAELIIAMSKFECGWDPSEVSTEKDGSHSIGLLQLSKSDQDGYNVSPRITDEKQLEDPITNLNWGVTILATRLAKDGVVATSSGNKFLGGAKYWSTLRVGNLQDGKPTLAGIIDYTKKQLNL